MIAAVIKQVKVTKKHTSSLEIIQNIIFTITFLNLFQRLTVNNCRQGSPPQKKMAEKEAEEGGVTFSQDIPEEETEPGKFCFHQRS